MNNKKCNVILSRYSEVKRLLYKWLLVLIAIGLLPVLYLMYIRFLSLTQVIVILIAAFTTVALRLTLPYKVHYDDINYGFNRRCMYALMMFAAIAFITLFILSNYLRYPPSLGIDTWRDILWSHLILSEGRVRLVIHDAYSIPLVPLLYSLVSVVLGEDPIGTSVLLGTLYLILFILSVVLLSRIVFSDPNIPSPLASLAQVLVLVAVPWVSLWSVWFIPQAYSLLLFLSIFMVTLRRGSLVAITVMLAAMIIGHPGQGLLSIGLLTLLTLASSALQPLTHAGQRQLEGNLRRILIIAVLLYLSYTVNTLVINAITRGGQSILRAFRALILGEEALVTVQKGFTLGNPVSTAILGYGALSILATLGILGWLRNTDRSGERWVLNEAFLVYGLVLMVFSYVSGALVPTTDAVRYLGMTAYVTLGIGAVTILNDMVKRLSGRVFTAILLCIVVLSITLGGTLRPDLNPFNSGTAKIIGKAPTWSEQEDLTSLSRLINTRNFKILTDYRTHLMLYRYILIPRAYEFQGFTRHSLYYIEYYLGSGSIEVVSLGTYGYKLSMSDLRLFLSKGFMFIVRSKALDTMRLTRGFREDELLGILIMESNKVYSSIIQAFMKAT